jgi:hypothetical protein
MPATVAILGFPESGFDRRLASALEVAGRRPALLSLDAVKAGRPVTFRRDSIVWEGVDLLRAGAIFVERPVFPWPQPQDLRALPADPQARARAVTADREARSLLISALHAAAETRPVINPPRSAFLAASPGAALEALAVKGLPVHAWALGPAPDPAGEAGRVVLDAAGGDRDHPARRPPAGDPALILQPFASAVTSALVVGGRVAGLRTHASGAAWAAASAASSTKDPAPPALADLACRAAEALQLDVAAISITDHGGSLRVLLAEAGPDLPAWDADLAGEVVVRLSERLAQAALDGKGASA